MLTLTSRVVRSEHMQKYVQPPTPPPNPPTVSSFQLPHINIDTRKSYNAHIKFHIDYASVLWGCGELLFFFFFFKKKEEKGRRKKSKHRKGGKLILPDPPLSTEQKMSAPGILNLPQQLTYNKGIFMRKVLHNNSSDYLAQLFISHQSHYTNSRNNFYGPRLDLFKTSISFAGASLWNSLPQNIKTIMYFSSLFQT